MSNTAIYDRGVSWLPIIIKNELLLIFREEATPAIKELIMDSFKNNLYGVVQGEYYNLKPENMEPLLSSFLDNYNYVEDVGDSVFLTCPTGDDLNNNGMSLLGFILEGVPSDYYKIKAEQYNNIVLDSNMDKTIDSYLISADDPNMDRFSNVVEPFEFSGVEPTDIMKEANAYIKANMPIWVRRAIETAKLSLMEYQAGAI